MLWLKSAQKFCLLAMSNFSAFIKGISLALILILGSGCSSKKNPPQIIIKELGFWSFKDVVYPAFKSVELLPNGDLACYFLDIENLMFTEYNLSNGILQHFPVSKQIIQLLQIHTADDLMGFYKVTPNEYLIFNLSGALICDRYKILRSGMRQTITGDKYFIRQSDLQKNLVQINKGVPLIVYGGEFLSENKKYPFDMNFLLAFDLNDLSAKILPARCPDFGEQHERLSNIAIFEINNKVHCFFLKPDVIYRLTNDLLLEKTDFHVNYNILKEKSQSYSNFFNSEANRLIQFRKSVRSNALDSTTIYIDIYNEQLILENSQETAFSGNIGVREIYQVKKNQFVLLAYEAEKPGYSVFSMILEVQ
jgi:hypothetical protein